MQVIFLIGSDFYSYNFANELCRSFAKNNLKASFLVFRNELAIKPEKLQNEIKDLIFYERTVFSDVLLPYLKNHANQGNYLGLEALSKKYSINYEQVPVEDSQQALKIIYERVNEWDIDIAITLRCIVKFDKKLLDYFARADDSFFWNLHPGRLPKYRGIMPVFGAMLNREHEYGFSLHRTMEKLDDGPIIDFTSTAIDYSKSMLQNTLDLIPAGVDLIIKNLLKISKNEKLPYLIQDESQKGFYSFPTADELEQFHSQGLSIFSKDETIQAIQNQYLAEDQKHILNKYLEA